MNRRFQDAAKFFAGVAASETFSHWMLGLWGQNLFPMKFLGITFTEHFNWIAMAAWPFVFAVCAYLGWWRGESEDDTRSLTRPAIGGA
ncbi:MAG TPA: hypothetical protein VG797_02720 [Phycisphaerales bacterium]|nr:hypothetical protein [Phycisphaerales bacterium]